MAGAFFSDRHAKEKSCVTLRDDKLRRKEITLGEYVML